jgi:hypothetical protein
MAEYSDYLGWRLSPNARRSLDGKIVQMQLRVTNRVTAKYAIGKSKESRDQFSSPIGRSFGFWKSPNKKTSIYPSYSEKYALAKIKLGKKRWGVLSGALIKSALTSAKTSATKVAFTIRTSKAPDYARYVQRRRPFYFFDKTDKEAVRRFLAKRLLRVFRGDVVLE